MHWDFWNCCWVRFSLNSSFEKVTFGKQWSTDSCFTTAIEQQLTYFSRAGLSFILLFPLPQLPLEMDNANITTLNKSVHLLCNEFQSVSATMTELYLCASLSVSSCPCTWSVYVNGRSDMQACLCRRSILKRKCFSVAVALMYLLCSCKLAL